MSMIFVQLYRLMMPTLMPRYPLNAMPKCMVLRNMLRTIHFVAHTQKGYLSFFHYVTVSFGDL